jgi:hypothetical protein
MSTKLDPKTRLNQNGYSWLKLWTRAEVDHLPSITWRSER